VNIGDFFDMPSLSVYDKGKLSFEGRRLAEDIEAGKEGMKKFLQPLRDYQKIDPSYQPRMVFCLGNHEERLQRVPSNNSEFEGFIGYHLLELEKGWGRWMDGMILTLASSVGIILAIAILGIKA
jgi:hypothetical protein